MEVELCRDQAKRLVSLSMWSCLQPSMSECAVMESGVIYLNFFLFYCRASRTGTQQIARVEEILEETSET